MKMVSLCVIALSFGGLVLACSSDDSSTSGPGGSNSACTPSKGTYKVKYTKDASSTGTCTDIPEATIEIKDSTGDGGSPQSAPGCSSVTNNAACTNTTTCSNTQSGITIESKTETKYGSSGISGSMETKTTGSPAGDSNCKYTFTWTKQ